MVDHNVCGFFVFFFFFERSRTNVLVVPVLGRWRQRDPGAQWPGSLVDVSQSRERATRGDDSSVQGRLCAEKLRKRKTCECELGGARQDAGQSSRPLLHRPHSGHSKHLNWCPTRQLKTWKQKRQRQPRRGGGEKQGGRKGTNKRELGGKGGDD